MVIVAIPSSGEGGLNDIMNQRFGRCPSFTLVTIEGNEIKEVKGVPNNASDSMGGAGIQAAQTIGNYGAKEVIAGLLGPNAVESLKAMKLKIFQAPDKQVTIKEVIDSYLKGELKLLDSANVDAHHGIGGRGMSGGRR